MINQFNTSISFSGVQFNASAHFDTLSGSKWYVDKLNSPNVARDYRLAIAGSGSLSGRIEDPALSGEFPPDWAPGDPWATWAVYAQATAGISLSGQAEFRNEYSPAVVDVSGSGNASGELEVGVEAEAQVAGYTATGNANANASVHYTVRATGALPNKRLEGQWAVDPITLTAMLELRDPDNIVIEYHEFSHSFWGTQGPWTELLGSNDNPGK